MKKTITPLAHHQLNRLQSTLLLLSFVWLTACGAEQNSEENSPNTDAKNIEKTIQLEQPNEGDESIFTIMALGDSLTEGLGVKRDASYPSLLEKALHQQGLTHVKVINSGLSGETSSGLKSRVDWVLQLKPDLTILNIGANDAMRGLPLELTSNNLSEIITTIQATGSAVVLAGMQIYDNLGQEYVAGFKDMYPKIAKKHQLTMIPFFLDHVAGDASLNQADMIHPTAAGYAVIVERNVLPTVLPVIKQLISDSVQQ